MQLHLYRWPPSTPTSANDTSARQTLVFLHGMGGTGALWRPIAAGLEERYEVLAPDQRGHGLSQKVSTPSGYHPLAYGQDVVDTLHAEGRGRVLLIGHSMGVRSACAVAHLAPELIQGLVLIDLGLTGPAGGGLGDGLFAFLKNLPLAFESRAQARQYLTENCPDPAMGAYLAAVAISDLNGRTTFPFSRDALLETLAALNDFSVREWALEAARNGLPILALRGALSRVWDAKSYALEKALFAPFPRVRFEEFEGAGHGLPFEKRALFLERLEAFAQSLI